VARARVTLGCDLELVEPHTQAFVEDYFTPEEKELIARTSCDERSRAIALLWSAKESLLKALRTGLRADTRSAMIESVESHSAGNGNGAGRWAAIRARTASGQPFHGWWREADGLVRTLIGPPGTLPPVALPV
jgi:4'-phosphopantetheinyl transferase